MLGMMSQPCFAVAPGDLLEQLLVVAERDRDFDSIHVTRREAVEKRLLLVDGVAEPTCDEIGQADADRVAVRSFGERQGGDQHESRACRGPRHRGNRAISQ